MIKASGVLFSSCLHPFDELWLQQNPIFNGLVDAEELKSLFWFKTKYGNLFSPDPTSNLEGFVTYLMMKPEISCIFALVQKQTRGQQDCSRILELFSWSQQEHRGSSGREPLSNSTFANIWDGKRAFLEGLIAFQ